MGQIITFFSYKGGVGRSMALANVATMMSRWGYKTLIVDWDLEAPGLENFFQPANTRPQHTQKQGLVDVLTSIRHYHSKPLAWRSVVQSVLLPESETELHLIAAGQRSNEYFRNVRDFDVQEFYENEGGGAFIENLRDEWKANYDFILIDSRTGVTDIGGICTIQMPDILVLLFTPTEQGLQGTLDVAQKAVIARQNLPIDRAKLLTVPIASRFDTDNEFDLSRKWLSNAAYMLKDLFVDWLPVAEEATADSVTEFALSPVEFLEITKLPYKAFFSFGEKLAVVEENINDPRSLAYAYTTLTAILVNNLNKLDDLIASRDEFVRRSIPIPFVERNPVAFLSYVRFDDDHDDNQINHLAERLRREVQAQTGETLNIFLDRKDIKWREQWQQRVNYTIDKVTFLIPILTPGFFRSTYCREELERFLVREQQLGRSDLIIPIYYISTPALEDPDRRVKDPLAQILAQRQRIDWRNLRFESFSSVTVRRSIAEMASQIVEAIERTG